MNGWSGEAVCGGRRADLLQLHEPDALWLRLPPQFLRGAQKANGAEMAKVSSLPSRTLLQCRRDLICFPHSSDASERASEIGRRIAHDDGMIS